MNNYIVGSKNLYTYKIFKPFNYFKMKTKYKFIVGIIIFLIAFAIYSDWENAKAGFLGKPPIEKVEK
jgi:hypothetical protein